jgi:hypothetical protein
MLEEKEKDLGCTFSIRVDLSMSVFHRKPCLRKMPAETEATILGCRQRLIDVGEQRRTRSFQEPLLVSIVISTSLPISPKGPSSNGEPPLVEVVLARWRFIAVSIIDR